MSEVHERRPPFHVRRPFTFAGLIGGPALGLGVPLATAIVVTLVSSSQTSGWTPFMSIESAAGIWLFWLALPGAVVGLIIGAVLGSAVESALARSLERETRRGPVEQVTVAAAIGALLPMALIVGLFAILGGPGSGDYDWSGILVPALPAIFVVMLTTLILRRIARRLPNAAATPPR